MVALLCHNHKYNYNRGCSKTSVFGTATLDLMEKAGFRPLFQEVVSKLTEFWNNLNRQSY
jgi:hypothetical protein